MTVLSVLALNKTPYSWNSSQSRFNGALWPGVVAVDYSEKVDVETVYTQTGDGVPVGATAGQYSVDSFTIKMLDKDFDALTSMLIATAPQFLGSYNRIEFTFACSVAEPLVPGAIPIAMIAPTCRIIGKKRSHQAGISALVTEVTLWTDGISENGKTLYSRSLPGVP